MPNNRSQDRKHRRKRCRDCVEQGLENRRPSPHPGPRCTTHHREHISQKKSVSWSQRMEIVYGITAEQYWQIYEHQGEVCYICRRATGKRKRLSVDHCHETGTVRGLLCTPCNRNVLGHARDEIEFFERAVDYLLDPPAIEAIGVIITPDMREEP